MAKKVLLIIFGAFLLTIPVIAFGSYPLFYYPNVPVFNEKTTNGIFHVYVEREQKWEDAGINDDGRAIIKQLIHSFSETSVSNPIKDVDSGSKISLSMYEQNVILETLIALLNKKQIISEEELLSELKKKEWIKNEWV